MAVPGCFNIGVSQFQKFRTFTINLAINNATSYENHTCGGNSDVFIEIGKQSFEISYVIDSFITCSAF